VERKKGQRYSNEFRRQAVKRMNACDNIVGLARELGVGRRLLYVWRDRLDETESSTWPVSPADLAQANPQAQAISEQNSGTGFFQACLAKSRGSTSQEEQSWRRGIYEEIRKEMPLQGHLSVERMCRLADVSRAGFYRYLRGRSRVDEEMTIRSAVQDIAIEHRWRYGCRRVTAELRAQGMTVNHKRIARIMQQDNLLAVRREWFRPGQQRICATRIYLNLANFCLNWVTRHLC